MTLRSSEENYKIAKSLYQDITDDFFEIENNPDSHDDSYLIDQTLDDIKKLNRHIRRINIEDLDEGYDDRVLEIIAVNVDSFKEASYFIERALISMKLFDKLHPVLEDYMKDVNWKIIADDLDKAVIKFGRFLTNEENFSQYKSMVWNIIKGTMKKKKFKEIFNLLSKRLYKPRKEVKTNKQNPLPPQMWSKEEKEKWEEQIENRKKQAVKDKKIEFDDLGERFISLEYYKKLNEGKNQETQYRIKDDFLQYKKGLFWKPVPKPYVDDYDGVRKPFTSNFMFPEEEFKKRHFSVYKNSLNREYKGGIFIGDDFYNINRFIETFKNIDDYLKLYKVEQDKLEKKSKAFNKEKREKQKQLDKEKRIPKYLKN